MSNDKFVDTPDGELVSYPGEDEEACLSVLSLRDYFAGQALCGHIMQYGDTDNLVGTAQDSYELADAMLAARAARKEGL